MYTCIHSKTSSHVYDSSVRKGKPILTIMKSCYIDYQYSWDYEVSMFSAEKCGYHGNIYIYNYNLYKIYIYYISHVHVCILYYRSEVLSYSKIIYNYNTSAETI